MSVAGSLHDDDCGGLLGVLRWDWLRWIKMLLPEIPRQVLCESAHLRHLLFMMGWTRLPVALVFFIYIYDYLIGDAMTYLIILLFPHMLLVQLRVGDLQRQ